MPRKTPAFTMTDLERRFCELYATEKSAAKAWDMALFDLGLSADGRPASRVEAQRALAQPQVAAYLEQCRQLVQRVFPKGLPAEEEAKKRQLSGLHPSKYKPEYCEQIVAYFNQPSTKEVEVVIQTRGGGTLTKTETQGLPPRHMTAFARSINVTIGTLKDWATKYPEFGRAYEYAEYLIREHGIDNSLMGTWNAQSARLYLVNHTDMRDRTAVDVTSEGRALAPTVSVMPPQKEGA